MARFIMANRRAGLFTDHEKLRSRDALNESFEKRLSSITNKISEHVGPNETSRRTILLEGEPQEIEALRSSMPPEVIIEPEILHYSAIALPLDLARMRQETRKRPLRVGEGTQMNINVRGSGQAVLGAEVRLFLRGPFQLSNELVDSTDVNGRVVFNFSSFWQPAALIINPVGGFWRKIVRGPRDGQTINLRRLPAGSYTAWWHRLHGINAYNASRGQGVRVGVIDTGLGPHPNVAHVNDQGAYIDGQFDPGGGADVDSHGTHVAGIIGTRPNNPGEYAGLAPMSDLFTIRVFPPGQGANQGDIVNAIDHLSIVNSCDLINLSLGSSIGSEIEHDAIIDALERGK